MVLSQKTLEFLREMINQKTEYRSGPKIIQFFNGLGFNDTFNNSFKSSQLRGLSVLLMLAHLPSYFCRAAELKCWHAQ